MLNMIIKLFLSLLNFVKWFVIPFFVIFVIFSGAVVFWYFVFTKKYGLVLPKSSKVPLKKRNIFQQLLIDLPNRYTLDMFEKDPDFFAPQGIHMFSGEQGCGKTIACVHKMMLLREQYPKAICTSNFGVTFENDELNDWRMLLDYNNDKRGVIVGIDEIQNWFMSGVNKLPEEMLEIATQNRKNRRIICCTAQVFTRVNKGIREQVTLLYEPHTFLGCFTVVFVKKPILDAEGNVIEYKHRGMYSFVHTAELRNAYDTYKVIHTLSKEGFKEKAQVPDTKVYVLANTK